MVRETERAALHVPGGKDESPVGGSGETGEARRKRGRGWKLLLGIGAALTLCGLLTLAGVFLYIHYTNRRAAGAQEELFRTWERRPPAPEREPVAVGDGIARILVTRLDLDAIVVELEGLGDTYNLKRGPGHIPGTAYPGQPGNCVISGHRTTYGAPFRHIDELGPGDEIVLETAEARYIYVVYEQRVVLPTDLTVLEQGEECEVTLTACHPWYSASRRIVVRGRLARAERSGGWDEGDAGGG